MKLNWCGKLVKNLPYRLVDAGVAINNVQIKKPVVNYTLPDGKKIVLIGDARHDRKSFDADGMVDLIIDENNPDNYFIDFEINRITGNLPTDIIIVIIIIEILNTIYNHYSIKYSYVKFWCQILLFYIK